MNRIGIKYIKFDRVIGWFSFSQTRTCPGPQGHSSQGRFFFFYVILSKKVINGKKSDFWTRFFEKSRYLVRFGQILLYWGIVGQLIMISTVLTFEFKFIENGSELMAKTIRSHPTSPFVHPEPIFGLLLYFQNVDPKWTYLFFIFRPSYK